jgi:hypothetical protein
MTKEVGAVTGDLEVAARVNKLLAELRAMLRSGDSIGPSRLSKYEDLVKRYGWLAGPVLSTLSNVAFRITGGSRSRRCSPALG